MIQKHTVLLLAIIVFGGGLLTIWCVAIYAATRS